MNIFSKNKNCLYAPMSGKLIPLSEVPDEAFSGGTLGRGIAVMPNNGNVYAPCSGVIDNLYPHAINLISTNGAQILIHVGLDTVALEGNGFTPMVKEGDKVKKGQLLLCCDLEFITSRGLNTVTPTVICNSDEFPHLKISETKDVSIADPIMYLGEKQ